MAAVIYRDSQENDLKDKPERGMVQESGKTDGKGSRAQESQPLTMGSLLLLDKHSVAVSRRPALECAMWKHARFWP
jgi:hypothetical protein